MTNELLPCPFCGSNRIIGNSDFYSGKKYKECQNCHSTSPTKESWNTRASGWVSVIEKLPKDKQEVIVCTAPYNSLYICIFSKDDNCFLSTEQPDMKCRFVKQWQPLPEPPKETT